MANQIENVSVYRYFLYDVLSNTFLAEVPFKGVSYGRAIKEAGPFSGSIPVIDPTAALDLYNTTIPGKTALYVVRDDTCVWGGIIWSRTYNIISRELQVNASEFTSYFHHRTVWSTWSHDHDASVTISGGTGSVTLTNTTYDFAADMPVFIAFTNENLYKYNNFFTINASPSPTTSTFSFDAIDIDGTVMDDFNDTCTVTVRADTYHYVRELLDQIKVDFKDNEFTNSEIEPGANYYTKIGTIARSSNVATITVPNTDIVVPGQRIKIRNVGNGMDGYHIVTSVPSSTSLTFANTGSNIPSTTQTGNIATILTKAVAKDGVATLTTDGPHGFSAGDIVTVDGVDYFLDGDYIIDSVTTNTIVYTTYSTTVETTKVKTATAAVYPTLVVGTYGSYSYNSDLQIGYSTQVLSGYNTTNTAYRGYQLSILGELLDNYSNIPNGFEYRIDCDYSPSTNSFTRTLVLLPFKPASLTAYYNSLPGGEMMYDLYPVSPKPTVSGNIDLTDRPEYTADGGVKTLGAFATLIGSYYVILPTIIWGTGRVPTKISQADAITRFNDSGEQLGKFITSELATAYISALESLQQRYYVNGERYNDPLPISALGADKNVFEHPGNIIDATMEESAEDAATRFWVVGNDPALSQDASQPYAAAAATNYLGNMDYPWPILDQKESQSNIYAEAKLQAYAEQYLAESLPPISTFTISVNGSITPEVGSYKPGDWCSIIFDDQFVQLRLASGLEPRTTVLVRKIDSYSVSIPDTPTFPEKVTLQLITEAQVDKIGTTSSS